MNKLAEKIEHLDADTLKEMAVKLNDDFRDGADEVMGAVLSRLETLMPVADFVAFCEELAA